MVATCVQLTDRVRGAVAGWSYAQRFVANIASHDAFEKFLTESEGTLSVCMALAALLRDDSAALFAPEKLHRLAFALLSEATMRSCRVQLKVGRATRGSTYVRFALGAFRSAGGIVWLANNLESGLPSANLGVAGAISG